jgi:hypothetical protein
MPQIYPNNFVHESECMIMNGEIVKPNVVLIASTICGLKPENSRLKPIENCEESVKSY